MICESECQANKCERGVGVPTCGEYRAARHKEVVDAKYFAIAVHHSFLRTVTHPGGANVVLVIVHALIPGFGLMLYPAIQLHLCQAALFYSVFEYPGRFKKGFPCQFAKFPIDPGFGYACFVFLFA